MKIVPFFKKWEGGLSRNTSDSASSKPCPTSYNGKTGYHTNKGVTYATWVSFFGKNNDDRFFAMSDEDWGVIFKKGYWDKVKGDLMPAQFVADILVSWAWGSGSRTAIKQMQRVLGFEKKDQDGIIGNQTLTAIKNEVDKNPIDFFNRCCDARESFFRFISDPKNGTTETMRKNYEKNKRNLKGWINRLNEFRKTFKP